MARGVSQITPRLSILRSHPFFIDLDAKALDQLCQYASFRKFKRGATAFVRGDPGNSLFVVACGAVKMSVGSSEVFVVRQFETDQAFREERLWLIRVRV